MNDGIIDHPKAKTDCKICNGGWLDDGDYAMALVACPCTGEATEETIKKVRDNYDKAVPSDR
jgi:hypothetical protein